MVKVKIAYVLVHNHQHIIGIVTVHQNVIIMKEKDDMIVNSMLQKEMGRYFMRKALSMILIIALGLFLFACSEEEVPLSKEEMLEQAIMLDVQELSLEWDRNPVRAQENYDGKIVEIYGLEIWRMGRNSLVLRKELVLGDSYFAEIYADVPNEEIIDLNIGDRTAIVGVLSFAPGFSLTLDVSNAHVII